jgi:DNA-directed RNA polymerase specialized sigma24 family protein
MAVTDRDPFLWLAPRLADDVPAHEVYAARLMSDLRCYFAGNRCEAAEDLAAEVILRLIRKLEAGGLPECDSEEARRKYMHGIARNVLREWKRGPGVRELPLQETEGREHSLPAFDLAAKQCLELLEEVVKANLAQLAPTEQDILLESELNADFSPTLAQLARQKGTTAPAMRQRVHRARVRFRNLILESDRVDDLLRCLGLDRGAL